MYKFSRGFTSSRFWFFHFLLIEHQNLYREQELARQGKLLRAGNPSVCIPTAASSTQDDQDHDQSDNINSDGEIDVDVKADLVLTSVTIAALSMSPAYGTNPVEIAAVPVACFRVHFCAAVFCRQQERAAKPTQVYCFLNCTHRT